MILKRIQILPIVYILILIVLLIMPLGKLRIEQAVVSGLRGDYLLHCLVYTPWMLLGRVLFGQKLSILTWFIVGVIFVAMMEFVQCLIPYRGYNTYDLIAGEIGVTASLLIFLVLKKIIKSLNIQ